MQQSSSWLTRCTDIHPHIVLSVRFELQYTFTTVLGWALRPVLQQTPSRIYKESCATSNIVNVDPIALLNLQVSIFCFTYFIAFVNLCVEYITAVAALEVSWVLLVNCYDLVNPLTVISIAVFLTGDCSCTTNSFQKSLSVLHCYLDLWTWERQGTLKNRVSFTLTSGTYLSK